MKQLALNELQLVSGGDAWIGRDYINDNGEYFKYVREGGEDIYIDYWVQVDPKTMKTIQYAIDLDAKQLVVVK